MNKYLEKISEESKTLNKPFRTPGGPKKFAVYVSGENGPKKVTFGDPGMEIKRDDPDRRKNFRARHNCDNPGPKDKARYWSCRMWEKEKSVGDLTKKSAEKGIVIVDFDDTLSDAGHRKHHVEVKSGKPDFDEFNRRAHFDKPNMDVILKIRQLHKEGNDIVIMSGRSDMVKQQAIQWLQQNNVPYQRLIMRPASSRMKSTELKKIWLKDIDTKKVIAAIDDKPENLNMFKAHGIPSYRVRDGKIEGQIVSNKYLEKIAAMRKLNLPKKAREAIKLKRKLGYDDKDIATVAFMGRNKRKGGPSVFDTQKPRSREFLTRYRMYKEHGIKIRKSSDYPKNRR